MEYITYSVPKYEYIYISFFSIKYLIVFKYLIYFYLQTEIKIKPYLNKYFSALNTHRLRNLKYT